MKTYLAAAATALVIGVAPLSSALAFDGRFPASPFGSRDVETTGSIGGRANTSVPFYGSCPMSSAAEGNAKQQNFLVKQYGQTAGGYRC